VSAVAVCALLGRWPGVLTALLLAIDDIWIRNAVVGLREEVTGTLLVAIVAALFAGRASGHWRRWLAPAFAAAAALTRLDAAPFALFVLLWGAVAQRWDFRRSLSMGALFSILLLPTLGGYARTRGEVAPASTVIATNNWKEEFRDRLGTPGFEVDRRVTAFEYLFRYHTPPQLFWYTVRGTVRIYGEEVFESLYYRHARWSDGWGAYLGLHSRRFTPLLFLGGCLGLLWQRRDWRRAGLPVALCLVGVLPPIGFIAGVPGSEELYQARYAYMVAPFASGIVAWAVCSAIRRLAVAVAGTRFGRAGAT
ncbi:MAG: hypothetical protein ACRDI2_24325, partial [Chloroflexota bacterium]